MRERGTYRLKTNGNREWNGRWNTNHVNNIKCEWTKPPKQRQSLSEGLKTTNYDPTPCC